MPGPCICPVRPGARMAFLAGGQQIGGVYMRGGIGGFTHVVNAVTISADSAVVPDCRPAGFVHRHIHPVPGSLVNAVDIGWQAVLTHQLRVGVTSGAHFWALHPEGGGCWILNIVHAVAICTDRHILVIFIDQSGPMHTLFILSINISVAFAACQRNR